MIRFLGTYYTNLKTIYGEKGMGQIVGTQLPKVLQERKVDLISSHECYIRKKGSNNVPAWLGYGACFVGSNTAAR